MSAFRGKTLKRHKLLVGDLPAMIPKDRGEREVANNRAFPPGEGSKSLELPPAPSHTEDARLLGFDERQQVCIDLIFERCAHTVRRAFVNLELSPLDDLGGQ